LNYRHAYHAGNYADVMKHVLYMAVIDYLKLKDKPFFILDTHAGAGLTDLSGIEAQKTGEFHHGIELVLQAEPRHPLIESYVARIERLGGGNLTSYPGSPLIARDMMREEDRMALCELHPEDAATLKSLFRRDPQVGVHEMNGYVALKSMLPPKERRGVVLIDPPFEQRSEFDDLLIALKEATIRWPGGTYMIWYPVKDPSVSGAFLERLMNEGPPRTLLCELRLEAPDPTRMTGCGMIIVNPPWTLAGEARALLDWLVALLARGPGAGGHVEQLTA